MLLGIFHIIQDKKLDIPPLWFTVPFLGWISVALLSALINPEFFRTLKNMNGEYRLLLPFALLPALTLVDTRKLMKIYFIGVSAMACYGIIQYFFGVDWFRMEGNKLITSYPDEEGTIFHAKGNFSHHLTYAGFMLINVPLSLSLFLNDKKGERWFWVIIAILAIIAVLASLGRSGWMGMVLGTLILIFMLPRRYSISLFIITLCIITLFISLMATGWLQETFDNPNNPELVKRLLNTSLSYDKDRLYLWEAGWLGVKDHLWLGVGIGNEDYYFESYRQLVSERHGGYQFINSSSAGIHNFYLQIAFNLGIVGLITHLWLFGTIFFWCVIWILKAGKSFPFEKGLLWGAMGGLFGHMIAGMFDNNFFDSEVQNLVMIVMGLALYAGLVIRKDLAK